MWFLEGITKLERLFFVASSLKFANYESVILRIFQAFVPLGHVCLNERTCGGL